MPHWHLFPRIVELLSLVRRTAPPVAVLLACTCAYAMPAQAQAKMGFLFLPPVEYDRPYTGKLAIVTVATQAELFAACNNSDMSSASLACTLRAADNKG